MTRSRRWLAAGLAGAALLLWAARQLPLVAASEERLAAALEAHRTPQLFVPAGWPAPRYAFENNPVTRDGFALGRKLFYDTRLSRDGSVSCGSCHQQFAGFAHFDHKVSHGIGGVNGTRNAPALSNLAWQPDFMWDGAVHHLEVQPIAPLSNAVEMGSSLAEVLATVQASADYPAAFAKAFGSPGIDSQRLLRALAQFTGTLVSARSRYDRGQLTAQEAQGLAVFRQHCAGCHAEPLFTDYSYRNNGLDAEPKDAGRAVISGKAEDTGRFRVPSLRNVAVSSPYMHDGRFDTLEQVLDHYTQGIAASPTLDAQLAKPLVLTTDERSALLQFLLALTDERFLHDVRFAEPPSTAVVGVRAAQRLALHDARVELVMAQEGSEWVITVDDYASNAPLSGLIVQLRQGTRQVQAAEAADASYRLPVDVLDSRTPLRIELRGADWATQLEARLPVVEAHP